MPNPLRRFPQAAAFALTLSALAALASTAHACPNADKLLEHMIDAHGGMARWADAPTVSFENEFRVGETAQGVVAHVTVEQGRRRAYLDYPQADMMVAWDGEKAWSRNWSLPYPPRFIALLSYHFLNLPWLAADPGVVMGDFGRATLPNDTTEYFTMKLSYGNGVGDTPDDYFRLFVDPETHVLKACEYIVTYSALLPEGVDASPPNTLVFTEHTEVNGLTVPTAYTIYQADGSIYGSASIRNWSFEAPFDSARLIPSDDAVVDTSIP